MSNNLATNPHPAAFYYHNHLPFTFPPERIRSSSFRGTNTASHHNSIPYPDRLHEGGIEPDLNGFSILEKAFELDSFRLCGAVNLHFLISFTNQLITQSPITKFLIPQLNGFLILTGRGGGSKSN